MAHSRIPAAFGGYLASECAGTVNFHRMCWTRRPLGQTRESSAGAIINNSSTVMEKAGIQEQE